MANSDNTVLLINPQDPQAAILQQLCIITLLLRQGFNIPDEDSSLSQQPNPATSAIGAL